MGTPLDTFTISGVTYDRIADHHPGMSEVELRKAREALWKNFQDDPEVMYSGSSTVVAPSPNGSRLDDGAGGHEKGCLLARSGLSTLVEHAEDCARREVKDQKGGDWDRPVAC